MNSGLLWLLRNPARDYPGAGFLMDADRRLEGKNHLFPKEPFSAGRGCCKPFFGMLDFLLLSGF